MTITPSPKPTEFVDITASETGVPTPQPTRPSTITPTSQPTKPMTITPSPNPTEFVDITASETGVPTPQPTRPSTITPTSQPTKPMTITPSPNPTEFVDITASETGVPTPQPTRPSTITPTSQPTKPMTITPSPNPTEFVDITASETGVPTPQPTRPSIITPTSQPTKPMTITPSPKPTEFVDITASETRVPTPQPTRPSTITPTPKPTQKVEQVIGTSTPKPTHEKLGDKRRARPARYQRHTPSSSKIEGRSEYEVKLQKVFVKDSLVGHTPYEYPHEIDELLKKLSGKEWYLCDYIGTDVLGYQPKCIEPLEQVQITQTYFDNIEIKKNWVFVVAKDYIQSTGIASLENIILHTQQPTPAKAEPTPQSTSKAEPTSQPTPAKAEPTPIVSKPIDVTNIIKLLDNIKAIQNRMNIITSINKL
jgi:hypothetical protein